MQSTIEEFNRFFIAPLEAVLGKLRKDPAQSTAAMKIYFEKISFYDAETLDKAAKHLVTVYPTREHRWPPLGDCMRTCSDYYTQLPPGHVQQHISPLDNYTPFPPSFLEQVMVPWVKSLSHSTHLGKDEISWYEAARQNWISVNGSVDTWWKRNRITPSDDERSYSISIVGEVSRSLTRHTGSVLSDNKRVA